jgi:hypothetical protein
MRNFLFIIGATIVSASLARGYAGPSASSSPPAAPPVSASPAGDDGNWVLVSEDEGADLQDLVVQKIENASFRNCFLNDEKRLLNKQFAPKRNLSSIDAKSWRWSAVVRHQPGQPGVRFSGVRYDGLLETMTVWLTPGDASAQKVTSVSFRVFLRQVEPRFSGSLAHLEKTFVTTETTDDSWDCEAL